MDMLFNGILCARYYSSEFGMFLSVDPLASDFAAWSPYNYVMGNPLMFTDPTGMSAEKVDGDYYDNKGNYIGDDGIDDGKMYVLKNSKDSDISSFSCDELKQKSVEVYKSTQKQKYIKSWMKYYVKKGSINRKDSEYSVGFYSGELTRPDGNKIEVFSFGKRKQGTRGANGVSLKGSEIEGWDLTEMLHTHRFGDDSGNFSDINCTGRWFCGDIQTSNKAEVKSYMAEPNSNYIGLFDPLVYNAHVDKLDHNRAKIRATNKYYLKYK